MDSKFKKLKNDIENLEENDLSGERKPQNSSSGAGQHSKLASYVLLAAFLITFLFYIGARVNLPSLELPDIDEIAWTPNQPSEELLNRMGNWMQEMGFGRLSDKELAELRRQGVTATFTSQIRDAGYPDVTLEQLIALQSAGVSATYVRMMNELGYEWTLQDLIELRRANVTAHFTSNMIDLGYTREALTKEQLIRLRTLGITHQQAARAMEEEGTRPSIDDLVRFHISNQ